jgi:[acyl-carrier-protein] S-malonyltransferase
MLNQLAAAYPQVQQTFAEASAALGFDLWRLAQEGPAEELNRTQNTQPAMLAAGVAVWRVWETRGGPKPVAMAGHSLGEYSALVCAQALGFGEAVALVAERGRLMQEAVPAGQGAMAAVLGLEDDQVREVCAQAAEGQVVEAVNFNSPGQVVIAGARPAVERAIKLAKAAGSKRALLLPVSVPAHSSMMKPAAERLLERLTQARLRSPELPVLHNVSVTESRDPKQMRDLLTSQLYRPVRWVETVRELQRRGARSLVEMGPGKVLSGLNRRIDKQIKSLAVYDPDSLEKAFEALTDA